MTTTPATPPTTSDPATGRPGGSAAPGRPGGPPRRSLRPLLLRLHFYAAVLVAPFLLVAAISGGLYAVSPQLERVVHADVLTTDSRGPVLPLDRQVDAARQVEPDLPLLAVRPADGAGATTRVLLDDGRTDQGRRLAVFVDPVAGEVLGEEAVYGSSGSLPVRTWISELHRHLHLGEPGRLYSELAASWLGVVALAGLLLWWTGRRDGSRLAPRRGASARRRTRFWHGALGTWAFLGFAMLSATGLTWSTYAGANVTALRATLGWDTPQVIDDLGGDRAGAGGHQDHGKHGMAGETAPVVDSPGVGYQAALDAARSADLGGPVEVGGPTGATGTYVVQELDRSWPTQADAAAVDPASGELVDVVRFDDYPVAAKLARWGVDLHMGLLLGWVSQLALLALATVLAVMVVTGYRMWWQRRPTRGHRLRPGRPVPRGAWRSSPPVATGVLALGALAVGWALPLLGVSLAVFLVIDVVLGVVGGRVRRGQREGAAAA